MLSNIKLKLRQIWSHLLKNHYKLNLLKQVRMYEEENIENDQSGYFNMIKAFCATSGISHKEASSYISNKYPKRDLSILKKESIFNLENIDFEDINNKIRKDGYCVLSETLSEDILLKLNSIALQEPCLLRDMDGENKQNKSLEVIDLNKIKSILYSIPQENLVNNQLIQKIASDFLFINVAQNYLETEAIWDLAVIWWSTNFSNKADKNAAQWFHFDMDRIKWLKIFIYLTDVGPENGPHTFIKGTNNDGSIPKDLLAKGYNRLSDEEVSKYFGTDRFIEFVGKRGTIIIEDTRGLHKGKNVTGDPRCILQFEYSNSLFGAKYPTIKINESNKPFIDKMNDLSPRFLSNYIN